LTIDHLPPGRILPGFRTPGRESEVQKTKIHGIVLAKDTAGRTTTDTVPVRNNPEEPDLPLSRTWKMSTSTGAKPIQARRETTRVSGTTRGITTTNIRVSPLVDTTPGDRGTPAVKARSEMALMAHPEELHAEMTVHSETTGIARRAEVSPEEVRSVVAEVAHQEEDHQVVDHQVGAQGDRHTLSMTTSIPPDVEVSDQTENLNLEVCSDPIPSAKKMKWMSVHAEAGTRSPNAHARTRYQVHQHPILTGRIPPSKVS